MKYEGLRTHRWWGNQEPFHDATKGEADDLRRYDKDPLVAKGPILVIVLPLYRKNVRLYDAHQSHQSQFLDKAALSRARPGKGVTHSVGARRPNRGHDSDDYVFFDSEWTRIQRYAKYCDIGHES